MKKITFVVMAVIIVMLAACSKEAVEQKQDVSFSAGNTEISTEMTTAEATEISTLENTTVESTTKEQTTAASTTKNEPATTKPQTTQKQTTTKQHTTTTEKQTTKPQTTKESTTKKETTTKKPTTTKAATCTGNNNHSQACGNMGRWFNSKSDVKAYVDKEMKYWADLEECGKITREEYYKKCPSGYECWSCGYCGKWTGNFKY